MGNSDSRHPASAPLYLQFSKECRWRCRGHSCTHVPTALKKEWAGESTAKGKSARHFRPQEATEKGIPVRSPGFEDSLSLHLSTWVHIVERVGLPSSELKRLRDFERPRCAKGQRGQHPDPPRGRQGEGSRRKPLPMGS